LVKTQAFVKFTAIQYANRQLKSTLAFDMALFESVRPMNFAFVVWLGEKRELTGPVAIDLSGKVALVTGGTRGLGRDIAAGLAGAGAAVLTCGRNAPDGLPDRVEFAAADIRDPDAAKELIDSAAQRFGRLDILINNAGGSPAADAATASPRFFDSIIKLNLAAPMYMAQAAYPHLVAAGGGSIVNIASVSAIRPSPGTAAYGAAKAGLLNLTQSLAQEWGRDRIRVNAIIAGLMQTETAETTYGDAAAQAAVAASMPLGRMGRGADLAGAVLWLCSDLASWVSGARINVDGGGERPYFLDLVKGN
jgi:NAD(P)-dependent dehydrogenase (short-subunit alcohol dehydrogenase family)